MVSLITDRLWPALVAVLLVALLGSAPALADAMDRARMAPLASSERLRLFTYGRALQTPHPPQAITTAMRRTMERTGFYHQDGGISLLGSSLRFSPVVAWDDNINGGYFNDTLDLFGLQFLVSPDNLARAGFVFGGRVDGSIRLAYAEGRYLDLSAHTEAAWSPRHEIGRANAALTACARNHVTGWTFADVCVTAGGGWRELSSTSSTAVSASVAQLFAAGAGTHEVSVEVERSQLSAGDQNSITLGWASIWNRATTDISLTLGEAIPNASATRARLTARTSWIWHNRPVTLSAWHMRSSGGMLLGMPREDRLTGLGVSVQARPGMSVDLMHQVTRSTISLFDESRTGLTVRFQLGNH